MRVVQGVLQQAVMLLVVCAGAAFAEGPVIFFTDLESGPKSGGENNKGAFVTAYGTNLGATQGASTVTVGGGAVDNCPVWGAAWLWYQKIICQLGANAATGNIVVTVGGVASNPLPFTVRSGNIYFVSPSGNNGNNGSFASPWRDPYYAKNTMGNGDIAYIRAGTWNSVEPPSGSGGWGTGGEMLAMAGISGTAAAPKALIGYPGETATLACHRAGNGQCWNIRTHSTASSWWTFANLDLAGTLGTNYIVEWANVSGGNGLRFVGNKIHGATGTNVVFQGPMDGSYFLGNDDYHYWSVENGANTGERGYGLYYGGYGVQQNLVVQWNRFNQSQPTTNAYGTKGIQMYGHHAGDEFRNVVIANNQFWNNCRQAILMGGSDGGTTPLKDDNTQYIYNNLFVHNGQCDTQYGYSAVTIQGGRFGIHNNTFYFNGNSPQASLSGDILVQGVTSAGISNNIFHAPTPNARYCGYVCFEGGGSSSQVSGTNNLFFNFGNGPGYLTGNVNGQDPQFVNPAMSPSAADFRLQATSPARNAGATLTLVTRDAAGTPRPQDAAFDIGAYEFDTDSDPPPPPPPPPAPTATISAAPSSVSPGQSAVLTYGCTDCNSVTVNGTTVSGVSGQMTVTPATTTTYDLIATGAGGTATATTTVTVTGTPPPPPPPVTADLGLSKAHTGNFAQGQSGASYQITVSNLGSAATSGTVTVTDTLPASLTATAISGTGWSCTVSPLQCTRGSALAAGASFPVITVTVSVAANAPNSVTNTATVSGGGQQNTSNDTASDPTTITAVGPADLTVTKTHAGNFTQGQTGARYTITVRNVGGAATSGTVTLTDTLPTGLAPTAISGSGWSCTVSPLRCTRGSALAAGASYPAITVTVTVANNAANSVTNTATVSGGGQQNTANDTASDATTIATIQPDLAVVKTHTGDFTQGQAGARYTITVSNAGSTATSGTVTVTDTLPAGLTATAISGAGWSCTLSVLRCTRSNALAAGGSYPVITVTVTVADNAPNLVTNTATVSGGGQQNTSNDTASDVTNILSESPALALSPSVLQFTASAGASDVTQTFQGVNLGGGTLGWTSTIAMDAGQNWLRAGPTSGVAPSTVAVTVSPGNLPQGSYTGRVILTALPGANAINSPQTLLVRLTVGAVAPQINNGGIVNGASFATDGLNSPGSVAVLFGQNMAPDAASASSLPLPVTLLGTQVLVNGSPAPLFFVSPTQINFQMPFEVSGSQATVEVVAGGVRSQPMTAALLPAVPGIFSATSNGTGQGAVLNEDGTPNSESNPAAADSAISIYLTGMGSVFPPLPSGQAAGSGKYVSETVLPPALWIGDSLVPDVLFSGAAPGFAGLYQINVVIPPGTAPGSAITLRIQVGERSSNTVTIAVR